MKLARATGYTMNELWQTSVADLDALAEAVEDEQRAERMRRAARGR